jgi:stage V sporulation protein K
MRLLLEDSFEKSDLLTLTSQDLIFEDEEKE